MSTRCDLTLEQVQSVVQNYDRLPYGLVDGARRWIEEGLPPGGFLQAVIANDLKETVGRADHVNIGRLLDIVSFFYNDAPSQCWGSVKALHAWANPDYAYLIEFQP